MDDDDNYPNFGNAFPSTVSSDPATVAASWNPALRPHTEATGPPAPGAESDDDFFDRYPGATPKKGGHSAEISGGIPGVAEEQELDDEDPEALSRRRSISVQHVIDVRHEDATPEMLERVPSNVVEAEGPISRRESIHEEVEDEDEDEDAAILQPGDSAVDQDIALESRMPDSADGVETPQGRQSDPFGEEDEESAMRPEEHYEHQGEITEMEEAQELSVDAPLMEDEEDLPTPGFVSREPTMSISSREDTLALDGAPAPRQPQSKAQVMPPQLDRTFTTNFSDSPIEARNQSQPQSSIPDDWPSVGDDATFGELLDRGNSRSLQPPSTAERAALQQVAAQESEQISSPDTHHAELEQVAAKEAAQIVSPDDDLLPEEEGEIKEEDLAAAWGAVVEDDDMLLEDTPTDLDPSQFFGADDGGGFLEDELLPEEPAPSVQAPQAQQQQRPTQQYRPANVAQQRQSQQPQYGAPGSTFINHSSSHGRSAGTPTTGLHDVYDTHSALQQTPQQQPSQRPGMQQAQSFADKAKGGYQSPYDLPMEVVKPRRRQPGLQTQQSAANLQSSQPAPPPRTSSMSSSTAPTPTSVRPPSFGTPATNAAAPRRPGTAGSGASMSPPQSSHSGGSTGVAVPGAASVKNTPKTGSGFFEELPITTKPRARGTPHMPQHIPQTPPIGGPVLPQQQQLPSRGVSGSSYPPQAPQQQSAAPSMGLRRPDQLPLIPDQVPQTTHAPPAQPPGPTPSSRYSPSSQQHGGSSLPAPPAAQSRYSPAPTSTAQPPATASRYSPAPASAPTRHPSGPSNTIPGPHAFAPRTSSPLAAMTDKPHPPLPPEARGIPPSSPPKANGIQQQHHTNATMFPEPVTTSRYAPSAGAVQPPTSFPPPQRPRTQSPDTTMKGPRAATMAMQSAGRPSSAAGGVHPLNPYQHQQSLPKRPALPHRRQFSRELTFAAPQDERALDPLERWKGHPIFKWNAGGTAVSSFPKQTPFFAAGQGIPSVKCTPGAITVQDIVVLMPMEEHNAKFPGPLTARSKRQKKDVLGWLGAKIEALEREAENAIMDFSLDVSLRKRVEEKVILWKLVRIFLEFDGVLEGNPKIKEEVRRILLPNLAQMAQVADLQSPASASVMPDPVDKQVLFQIRQALLEGQRERAVWLAEEKKLWGHAMLIASTMGPDTWKQIIQTFVRSQVKSVGSDARSTAALYQVFAGNSEECVDELVPPSARAGFQMISKADGTVSGNPLEGLDQWRETLGLITSNRTANDGTSLLALGKMLAGYERAEAAHSCFLFARQFVKNSGPDDADVNFVLLGANHQSAVENFGSDLDSILLTEVYEYAASLSAPSTAVSYIPHLQAFKLVHAQELAAYGLKNKAQTYCDHITSAYTSTTRPSPYYHPAFTQAVAEFSAFLSQTPHDGKSGYFSKPALNKVSSGAASWFSKFVAGDDDQESTGSGPGGAGSDDMAGPFGRVNGESPSISRPASGTDLYGSMMGGGVPIPGMTPAATASFAPSSAPGRYAPGSSQGGSKYSPAHPYSGLGMPAVEPQRPSSSRYAPAPSSSLGVPRSELSRRASDQSLPYAPSSRRGSAQDTSSQGSYEPRPILSDEGSGYSYSPAFNSPLVQAQQAPAVQEPEDAFGAPNGIPEPLDVAQDVGEDPETGGGYLPPTSGYEPPSYQPYEPEPDSPEKDAKPKTRNFGDDDDDAEMEKTAAALKKAQADREADEAFRKAAEADAARSKADAGQKKGWLGGWFGKKDPNAGPGPIKAKLGEENSFYYDENLKKWVNKKGGPEAATPVAATPPPPKGPANRAVSAMGPPSGPPSRVSSGTGLTGPPTRPPTSGSGPALSGPPSGPPSRTGTPASESSLPGGAGVIGDASAPPVAPPIRPSSTLSTASSIDDLMGPPGSRKGGTVKGKKKTQRYVDVMKQ